MKEKEFVRKENKSEVISHVCYKYDYEKGEYVQIANNEWFRRFPRNRKKRNNE